MNSTQKKGIILKPPPIGTLFQWVVPKSNGTFIPAFQVPATVPATEEQISATSKRYVWCYEKAPGWFIVIGMPNKITEQGAEQSDLCSASDDNMITVMGADRCVRWMTTYDYHNLVTIVNRTEPSSRSNE